MIPDFIRDAGTELPFVLLLIALLGFRSRVTPRASVFIAAPPEKVFPLVDFTEGQNQRWQRTKVVSTLIEPETRTYKLSFVTPLAAGAVQSSEALFRVVRREPPHFLEIDRAGLEGKSTNNQLLKMTATLAPEGKARGWRSPISGGPRPLLAQLLARADLWGSVYRLKGQAETGTPDFRTDAAISASWRW